VFAPSNPDALFDGIVRHFQPLRTEPEGQRLEHQCDARRTRSVREAFLEALRSVAQASCFLLPPHIRSQKADTRLHSRSPITLRMIVVRTRNACKKGLKLWLGCSTNQVIDMIPHMKTFIKEMTDQGAEVYTWSHLEHGSEFYYTLSTSKLSFLHFP